jgi:DNA (cytosine-5)-methyltransferase 1
MTLQFGKHLSITSKNKIRQESIVDVPASEIPDVDGIIGGPPCQSWSEAGAVVE